MRAFPTAPSASVALPESSVSFVVLEAVNRSIDNPTRKMRLPKRDRRLPSVMGGKEIEQLIGKEQPEGRDRASWRDRALVETLYSCGARRRGGSAQLVGHRCRSGSVQVRHGRGDKFRLVPIGEVALDALNCWRCLTRSEGSREPFFINFRGGRRLTSRGLQLMVKQRPHPTESGPTSCRTSSGISSQAIC
jgi:integrase/recombinase XerC